jgi:7,8-dihydro-6-hydroxymethylpterin dimethyltransferase
MHPLGQPLRKALQAHGLFGLNQTAGRRWPIGCVSLEVTQRCNLDCTLCYLSEHSEAVKDFPLEEIFRRIDAIHARYGPTTDVQISGGDPTLRNHDELVLITQRIHSLGMRSSLFTNGIKASRALLIRLRDAGLSDVAFHVDLTQERKGFDTEEQLNALRLEYIDRAAGLGLSVFFNTTVYANNFAELPMLARFFAQQSQVVQLASFQMQADTGRGVLGGHAGALTQEAVMRQIESGCATPLNWDALQGGHPKCNRYATGLVWGLGPQTGIADLFFDGRFIARAMRETAGLVVSRGRPWAAAWTWTKAVLVRPMLLLAGLQWAVRLMWSLRSRWLELARGASSLRKVSFFIHNFMDAKQLDQERLDTCVFMAAAGDGFVPMCEYNARRDTHLLKALPMADGSLWQPLNQQNTELGGAHYFPIKFLKGRSRQLAARDRKRV